MAEGPFEGAFGEEAEAEEIAAEPSIGSDQTAHILALSGRGKGRGVERETEAYLRDQREIVKKQGRMLEIQMEHLHEQRGLNLRHMKVRHWRESLQLAFQLWLAVVVGAIVLGLAVMLYDAFTSRSVVVNAFKAPAALAGRGLTGDVVASGVLDALQKLQQATRGSTKSLKTKSAWSSDVKIEVPETGVSIGEINRLLHERFGHDLHIDGDLVQTETGGLALTVRGDGVPAVTFQGAGELDKLTTQAAEYVYGRSQPYQFQVYLTGAGRYRDTLAFLPGAFARATTDAQRADLANGWGNAYSGLYQPGPAIEKLRLAMSLAPRSSPVWWKAWGNLVGNVEPAQGEEAAWRESRAFLRAAAQAPKGKGPDIRFLANPGQTTWDVPLALAATLADAARNAGAGASTTIDGPTIADVYGVMHDPAQAARYMASSDPDDPNTKAEVPLLSAYAAIDRGDAATAVTPLEAFWKAWLADPNLQYTFLDNPCLLGLAYGMAGRRADAEAVFKRLGPWSRCYAVHGDVLVHAGDVAGAQRVWAEGLRIAPDLPLIYLHRGLFELDQGDLKAAAADVATANAKAPHFADPLKAWGDVLARQGQWRAALARYDEALKYAPAWAALHQARDAAAKRV